MCQKLCENFIKKHKIPGMSIAVSKDGKSVWKEGFGLKDVENQVKCNEEASMLISSISKPLVALVLMHLWQSKLVYLDEDIRNYVPEFPIKEFDGKKVVITLRQLLSHYSGLRHYKNSKETRISRSYDDVIESLDLFKNDDLVAEPGTKFNYSTYAYTLISCVMERASKMKFLDLMKSYFEKIGLNETYADEVDVIINNRSRYYRYKNGVLQNAPFVNCSYKWAGGGFTSTVTDLTIFANFMLFLFQDLHKNPKNSQLFYETVKLMWTPIKSIQKNNLQKGYGLGWRIEYCSNTNGYNTTIYHTGSGSGNSCVLLMKIKNDFNLFEFCQNHKNTDYRPIKNTDEEEDIKNFKSQPSNVDESTSQSIKGITVAILTNLSDVNLVSLAKDISSAFNDFSD